jgi:predicted nucleic acid-binding protein
MSSVFILIDFLSKVLYIVRMSVLVDANIYLAVILDEPEKKRIVELTQNSELVSPLVLPYEIGNALSAMFKRDRLTKVQVVNCFDIYNTIPVRLVDVDIKVALQIASDFSIYAYDAYYLEIAKRFKFTLLSLDKKMMSVALEMGIHVLEV